MNCKICGSHYSTLFGDSGQGLCAICQAEIKKGNTPTSKVPKVEMTTELVKELTAEIEAIILTTEVAHGLNVDKRLGLIGAETVFGINLLKDVAADIRGTFGGRSEYLQNDLRTARETCLRELKQEAYELGADAVVGIQFSFENIGSTGKMLMVIATGTAVKLTLE